MDSRQDWFEGIAQLVVAAIAFLIFLVAILSYRRRPTTRTLLVALGFAVYAAKALLILAAFLVPSVGEWFEASGVLFDAAFVLLIAAAFLKN